MTRICSWNVGPRNRWRIYRSFRTILPAEGADVVALFEASHPLLVALLRARLPHRRVICHRSDVVAILPRNKPRPRVEVVGHDAAWVGPHMGRRKRGRRWLLLVWDDEAILLIHRVTRNGGDNQEAWDADHQVIRDVCDRWDLPDRLAIIGDHNARADELARPYSLLGLKMLPVNAKVDQCAARRFNGGGKRLGNHGSDHVAILWRLG